MRNVWRLSFRFVVHIAVLFGFLVLATAFGVAWVSDRGADRLLEVNGAAIAERTAQFIGSELEAILSPVEVAVSLMAHHRSNLASSLPIRLEGVSAYYEALRSNDAAAAFYVGYENGEFFLVRRLVDDVERALFRVGPEVAYVVQSIDSDDGVMTSLFVHLDKEGRIVGEASADAAALLFDPRQRIWYVLATIGDGLIRTDLYVFQTTKKIGITLARRSAIAEAVVAADINLEALSKIVARNKPTPGSQVALINANGQIIAYERPESFAAKTATDDVRMLGINSFPVEELRELGRLSRSAERAGQNIRYQIGGDRWLGRAVPITMRGNAPLTMLVAMPERELLADTISVRDEMFRVWGAILVVASLLTILLSFSISRSVSRVSHAADRIRRFDFSATFRKFSHIKEINTLNRSFSTLQATYASFIRMVNAITLEKDVKDLLPVLLNELSAVLRSRKAVLYIIPPQHDDLTVAAVKDGERIILAADPEPGQVPALVSAALKRGGHEVLGGRVAPDELGFPGVGQIAHKAGSYEQARVCALRAYKGDVIGAILFLDCERSSDGAEELVSALTGVAAVSLETRQLVASQAILFESFIELMAAAIDSKSPHTGGHCARVPELTKMLARAAVDAQEGPYEDFTLSDDDWEAIHVASYLHDCGKITSPEYVIDKSVKLETIYNRIHEIRMRFELLKRDAEITCLKQIQAGADPDAARQAMDLEHRKLESDFRFVAACNEGGEFMSQEDMARLKEIAQRKWLRTFDDTLGVAHAELQRLLAFERPELPTEEFLLADKPHHIVPREAEARLPRNNRWGFKIEQPEFLHNRGELHNLLISRGTLTDEERYVINDHIIQTIIMLTSLPYPRHLRQVPEIAGGHHERMDGQGYPKRLKRDDMSPVARMMAIADIFEALTAGDRPYKKSKTLSEAIRIMSVMARQQHIDAEIFDLFLRSGVYLAYAERFIDPSQIDEVRIEEYLEEPSVAA